MADQNTIQHHRETYYVRFPLAQRAEHLLLLLSFGTLGFTGLIQKFSGNAVAGGLIGLLGGIEMVRILHHIAAIVMGLQTVYHVILLIYKVFVRRVEMTMLPGLRDAIDALDAVRFNLGLAKDRPQLPRYSFEEKVEYWAMIWGTIVMGLTGFMLWNPVLTTKLLPGEIIPAAKAAHGGEAVLAVLAILVWHFYNVHIKTFNKSMFTGKLTQHQMEHEHGAELAQLVGGKMRPEPKPEAIRRRERIFLPVALAIALIGIIGMYLFATYESTAIATVPTPAAPVQIFAPLTPTPVPSPTGGVDNTKVGTLIKHQVAGMEKCDTCHAPKGLSPAPADHAGRPLESCLICHRPAPGAAAGMPQTSSGGTAKGIPHSITEATYKDCLVCHGVGKMKPGPASHAAFANESCTLCHKLAPTPAATKAPVAGATPAASGPKPMPANHDPANAMYKDCSVCHGAGKMKPSPANHASFTNDSCATCHKAATGAAPATGGAAQPAAAAKPINHSIASDMFKDCKTCHGEGKMKPAPANHASFTVETCTTCHKPMVQ